MRDSRMICEAEGGVSKDDSKEFLNRLEQTSTDNERLKLIKEYGHKITTKNAANQVIRRAFKDSGMYLSKDKKKAYFVRLEPMVSEAQQIVETNPGAIEKYGFTQPEEKKYNDPGFDPATALDELLQKPNIKNIKLTPLQLKELGFDDRRKYGLDLTEQKYHAPEYREGIIEAEFPPPNESINLTTAQRGALQSINLTNAEKEFAQNVSDISDIPVDVVYGKIAKFKRSKLYDWSKYREAHNTEKAQQKELLRKKRLESATEERKTTRGKVRTEEEQKIRDIKKLASQQRRTAAKQLFKHIIKTPRNFLNAEYLPFKKFIEDNGIKSYTKLSSDLKNTFLELAIKTPEAQQLEISTGALEPKLAALTAEQSAAEAPEAPTVNITELSIRQKNDNKKSSGPNGSLIKKMTKLEQKNTKPRKGGKPPKTNRSHIIDEMVKHGQKVIVI